MHVGVLELIAPVLTPQLAQFQRSGRPAATPRQRMRRRSEGRPAKKTDVTRTKMLIVSERACPVELRSCEMYRPSSPSPFFLFCFVLFSFLLRLCASGRSYVGPCPLLRRAGTGWLVTRLILLTHIPGLVYDVSDADDWVQNSGTDGPGFATLTT